MHNAMKHTDRSHLSLSQDPNHLVHWLESLHDEEDTVYRHRAAGDLPHCNFRVGAALAIRPPPPGACEASFGSGSPQTPPEACPVAATRRSKAIPRPPSGRVLEAVMTLFQVVNEQVHVAMVLDRVAVLVHERRHTHSHCAQAKGIMSCG